MGCTSSRAMQADHLPIDDSIHAMLQHDLKNAKQKGQTPHGYRPRAPHPLLQENTVESDATDCSTHAKNSQGSTTSSNAEMEDVKRIMFHAKHHCDTVDARDLKPNRVHQAIAEVPDADDHSC